MKNVTVKIYELSEIAIRFDVPILVYGHGSGHSTNEEFVAIARLSAITTTSEGTSFLFLEGESSFEPVWFNVTHWSEIPKRNS